jgi:hypothetical protein
MCIDYMCANMFEACEEDRSMFKVCNSQLISRT